MSHKSTILWESSVTMTALIRSISIVCYKRVYTGLISCKFFVALSTLIRSFPSVCSQMVSHSLVSCESFVTLSTLIWISPVCILSCVL